MCHMLERAEQKGREKGRIEGRIEGKVLAYSECGLSVEDIATRVRITEQQVKEILDKNLYILCIFS